MKRISFIFLILFTVANANAQHKRTDSLYVALSKAGTDTTKLNALIDLSRYYYLAYPDSGIIFGQQAYELADKHNWIANKGRSLNVIANAYATLGDYVKAMQFYLKSSRIYESINDLYGMATENNNIGATYIQKGDNKNALPYLRKSTKQMETYGLSHKLLLKERHLNVIILENIGECLLYLNQIDSADHYLKICYPAAKKDNLADVTGPIERDLGEVALNRNDKDSALKYFRDAVVSTIAGDDVEDQSAAYLSIGKLYHKYKLRDSAEYYVQKALETAAAGKFEQDVLNAGQVLYAYYDEDHNLPQAYKYYKITTAAKDSLYSQDKVKQLLTIDFDEKQRQEDIAAAQNSYAERVRTYAMIAGLAILLLLVFIFWRNGKHRQAANELLQRKNEDIESALAKLQLTQTQLIQSEKMASLGELTAGIAHEIQNPLNFINNFSEVNQEMIDEMEEELKSGNIEDALAIAVDIKLNEEKINHHGRRADSIVKGMLQHSRSGSGQKELTDINALADEYLRLSYHGLRAKDKSFNSAMETYFDDHIPLVNINPQDIGRVVLNLLTNAFYSVNEKKKLHPDDYEPLVAVKTKRVTLPSGVPGVEVIVRDNGMGIPQKILDKIYQPFFTTKPTGQGTGLGLSMSYDIVKAHGGELKADTKEGEFTEFSIQLTV